MAYQAFKAGHIQFDRPYGLIVSTEPHEKITITLAASTRDAVNGHTPTTQLRWGLAVTKITSGPDAGKYKHYDPAATDGSEDESTAVFLVGDCEIDTVNGGVTNALFKGTAYRLAALVPAGFDFDKCQRIAWRYDVQDGN